jgi:hypothetical protein
MECGGKIKIFPLSTPAVPGRDFTSGLALLFPALSIEESKCLNPTKPSSREIGSRVLGTRFQKAKNPRCLLAAVPRNVTLQPPTRWRPTLSGAERPIITINPFFSLCYVCAYVSWQGASEK